MAQQNQGGSDQALDDPANPTEVVALERQKVGYFLSPELFGYRALCPTIQLRIDYDLTDPGTRLVAPLPDTKTVR